MRDETFGTTVSDTRSAAPSWNGGGLASDAYLPWIAIGAVAIGAVGAVLGLMQHQPARRQAWPEWRPGADPEDLTPPHGDKLQQYE